MGFKGSHAVNYVKNIKIRLTGPVTALAEKHYRKRKPGLMSKFKTKIQIQLES
jgi:hypothetical protein